MFLPELGKQIQGERHITSNNRVIRISAGSNNQESTVQKTFSKLVYQLTGNLVQRATQNQPVEGNRKKKIKLQTKLARKHQ